MPDRPEKKKPDEKPTILKTDDEIMDDLFSPEVEEKLKKVAHDSRPKEKKPAKS